MFLFLLYQEISLAPICKNMIFFPREVIPGLLYIPGYFGKKDLTIYHWCLGDLSRYRCSICLFFNLISESWNQGKDSWAWRRPGWWLYKSHLPDSPLFFPKPKTPGRVMMGAPTKSPKNKPKCSVKLVCKLRIICLGGGSSPNQNKNRSYVLPWYCVFLK